MMMTKSLFVVTLLSLPVRRIATAVNCKLKKAKAAARMMMMKEAALVLSKYQDPISSLKDGAEYEIDQL